MQRAALSRRKEVALTPIIQRAVIDRPMALLLGVITVEPGSWLRPFLRIAAHEAEEAALRLQGALHVPPRLPSTDKKTVSVTAGSATFATDEATVSIPVHWVVDGYAFLTPEFRGHMQIAPAGSDQTILSIHGSFSGRPEPPRADIGARLITRRASETSLRSLLSLLRSALEAAELQSPA